MGALSLSFFTFILPAITVGALVHSRGRERMQNVLPFEFIFIFMPYITLLIMGFAFFGSISYFDDHTSVWLYFWLLQAFSAGILGGFVLMPRYFVKAETTAARILVNTIGGLTISAIFAFSRIFLFAVSSINVGNG